jgi:hypothetical protein
MVCKTKRRALRTSPGSQTSSSSMDRTSGNHGDPGMRAEGTVQLRTSLRVRKKVMHARKSESPIVALKSGNSDGVKGRQYWDRESMVNMPRHRADSAHDH